MNKIFQLAKASTLCLVFYVLFGCGGGSEQEVRVPAPVPPILVNAGQAITSQELLSISLDGSASGGNGDLSYTWQASPNIAIIDENPADPIASLVAPAVRENTDFQLTLIARDNDGNQGQDSIVLSVIAVNQAPIAIILAEQQEAYPENSFTVLSEVVLDGSTSSDADPFDEEQAILTYSWEQIAGFPILNGSANSTAAATNPKSQSASVQNTSNEQAILRFNTPLFQADTTAEFMLTVTDQEGLSDTSTINLTFLAESKTQPTISLGPSITVMSGEKINLSASASSIAPNAPPFDYRWSDDAIDSLNYDELDRASTFAFAPDVDSTTNINFSVSAQDAFGNTVSESLIVKVEPYAIELLNDTGFDLDANETALSSDYQGEFAGQDGHRGNDALAITNTGRKVGQGTQGFDFTRLNQQGIELDSDQDEWACVRDNVTNLVWQVHTLQENSLHQSDQLFTWRLEENNGDFEGVSDTELNACHLDAPDCNLQAYVNAVNQQGLCSFFDWRIPSHLELQSIVHFGKANGPLIDDAFFPYLTSLRTESLWFWTLQSSVDGVLDNGAQTAWAIDFMSGIDGFWNKGQAQRVILVRAGRTLE